jgi:hypothetical protein
MSNEKPLPFQYSLLAGAIAGVSEILAMYPLDGKPWFLCSCQDEISNSSYR